MAKITFISVKIGLGSYVKNNFCALRNLKYFIVFVLSLSTGGTFKHKDREFGNIFQNKSLIKIRVKYNILPMLPDETVEVKNIKRDESGDWLNYLN